MLPHLIFSRRKEIKYNTGTESTNTQFYVQKQNIFLTATIRDSYNFIKAVIKHFILVSLKCSAFY